MRLTPVLACALQKIVIVMTDGESNVHRQETIPQAQLLHDAGYKVSTSGGQTG
jgi:hypothetical protein